MVCQEKNTFFLKIFIFIENFFSEDSFSTIGIEFILF